MAFQHTSVLLEETIDGLAVKPDGFMLMQHLAEADTLSKCAAV